MCSGIDEDVYVRTFLSRQDCQTVHDFFHELRCIWPVFFLLSKVPDCATAKKCCCEPQCVFVHTLFRANTPFVLMESCWIPMRFPACLPVFETAIWFILWRCIVWAWMCLPACYAPSNWPGPTETDPRSCFFAFECMLELIRACLHLLACFSLNHLREIQIPRVYGCAWDMHL